MYHNDKPAIRVSTLPTGHVDFSPGQPPMVVCAECGQWAILSRKTARWHTNLSTGADCIGGGQRYTLDASPTILTTAYAAASRDAAKYRAQRTHLKPQPPKPESVVQIARSRRKAIEACAAVDRLEHALA